MPNEPPPQPPVVRAATAAAATTVYIGGELDATVVPLLSEQLAQAAGEQPRLLIFDLAAVDFMDCAAARLIVGTGRALTSGRRPVIRHPRPIVRRVLQLTGLDAHCEIDP